MNYILKWITPFLSQKEIEALFNRINHTLIAVGSAPLLNISHLNLVPVFEPEDGFQIHFPLTFDSPVQADAFRKAVWSALLSETSDQVKPHAISFVSETVSKTPKRLCVFDMDSTLIDQEVIDELARLKGFYDEVAVITESAMRGELDFEESLQRRVQLLRGMAFEDAVAVIPQLSVSAGGEELLRHLQKQKIKTAIVSGGFEFVLKDFQKRLAVDEVFGHQLLQDDDDLLSGEVKKPVINAAQKQKLVSELKHRHGYGIDETIAVGDGANDILMMNEAGLSVSFAGKPKLSAEVNTLILNRNLLWLKHLL